MDKSLKSAGKSIINVPTLKEKIFFWGAVTGLSTIIGVSGYYLFKYLMEDYEDQDKNEETKSNSEIKVYKREDFIQNNQINLDNAIKASIQLNKISENYYQKKHSELEQQRRDALTKNNELLYAQLCQETFVHKQECLVEAAKEIFKDISIEEFQSYTALADPKQMEELAIKYSEADSNDQMTKEKAKEAYIYYVKTFIEEHQKLTQKYPNISSEKNEERDQNMMIDFFILKTKIDDLLNLKFQISEQKLSEYITKNQLLLDPDIQHYQSELEKLSQDTS